MAARSRKQRGLTLLEVVIALMLFAMISVFLLSGHAQATDATLRAQVEREMAELLSLRINLIALQHEDYEDGDSGGFPYSGASDRLVDEQDVFGDLYLGYTWEVSMERTIGTGATGPVSVDDGEQRNLLFAEEGAAAEGAGDEEVYVGAEEVDQMMFIRVTVYPPGYDASIPLEEQATALRPRSAWTAIHLLPEDNE